MAEHGSVSAEDFVRTWESADSIAEVGEKTGMARGAINSRAAHYRKSGIPLKRMARQGRRHLDIEALKALCSNGADDLPLRPVEAPVEGTAPVNKPKRKRKR
jgi:hypothetical protein